MKSLMGLIALDTEQFHNRARYDSLMEVIRNRGTNRAID